MPKLNRNFFWYEEVVAILCQRQEDNNEIQQNRTMKRKNQLSSISSINLNNSSHPKSLYTKSNKVTEIRPEIISLNILLPGCALCPIDGAEKSLLLPFLHIFFLSDPDPINPLQVLTETTLTGLISLNFVSKDTNKKKSISELSHNRWVEI